VVIVRNVVNGANADAINLVRPTAARILGNELHGSQGVLLDGARDSQVTGNAIDATGPGVVLQQGCDGNKVDGNRISGVQSAGIVFAGDNSGNRVHGNRVTCAPEAACVAVDASAAAWEQNRISGNLVVK
jgi:nitrous oxidase accessory protein NosD